VCAAPRNGTLRVVRRRLRQRARSRRFPLSSCRRVSSNDPGRGCWGRWRARDCVAVHLPWCEFPSSDGGTVPAPKETGMTLNRRALLKLGLAAASGPPPTPSRLRNPRRRRRSRRLPELCGCPRGYHALHRVPEVRGGLQPPEPSPPHGRILLGQGCPPLLPPSTETAFTVVNRFREVRPGPGRLAPDVLQGPVHALPLPFLRVGVHRGRTDQGRRRRRRL